MTEASTRSGLAPIPLLSAIGCIRTLYKEKRKTMSEITLPKAVENFVAANNTHDVDALMATLAADAVVSDDGKTYTDDAGIRDWIGSHLVGPKIVITPTSFEGNRMVASSAGDFPGSPQPFAFNFELDGDLVKGLSIDLA